VPAVQEGEEAVGLAALLHRSDPLLDLKLERFDGHESDSKPAGDGRSHHTREGEP